MHEAEGINFKVDFIKKPLSGKDSRRLSTSMGPKYDNPSISDVIAFVNKLNIEPDAKERLATIARGLPHGSLGNFRLNYRNYLKRLG
jgi:hypothetical protein